MNIAVFASGRGSNFKAILNSIESGFLSAKICVVISDNASAGALELARIKNIPVVCISQKQFVDEATYSIELLKILNQHKTDLIALAGYLKKIPNSVVQKYYNRILNIHPALLPAFGGKGMYGHHVHKAVIDSGVKITGATVHLVNEEYDRGPILIQKTVEINYDDTEETIAKKVLKIEHEIFPYCIKAFAEGRVKIEGNKSWIM